MDILKDALGGLTGDQPDRMRDFSRRYQDGPPDRGYTDEEARETYGSLAGRLPTEEYESSAQEAFSRLSPEDRRQFGEWLEQRSGGRVHTATVDDPAELARATNRVREEQPDILQQVFGEGGALSNPIAKIAVAGIAAMAAQRMFGKK